MDAARFAMFIAKRSSPAVSCLRSRRSRSSSAGAGFTVARMQSLQLHYARTLDIWAEALDGAAGRCDRIQSEEVYRPVHEST